jgi:hypothetical protein
VRPHTAVSVKQFLAKQGLQNKIASPPLSILLTYAHAERRFEDTEDIERYVTGHLLALHTNELKTYFQQFYGHKSLQHLQIII